MWPLGSIIVGSIRTNINDSENGAMMECEHEWRVVKRDNISNPVYGQSYRVRSLYQCKKCMLIEYGFMEDIKLTEQ